MHRPPYGITGFHYYLDPPPPSTDETEFLNHCYAFARHIGARVVAIDRKVGTTEKNFSSATLKTRTETFVILFNAHYPVLAFAEKMPIGDVIHKFIERPDFATYWDAIDGYSLLRVADLTISPHDMELADISDTEYDQIIVHKPRTSGEIIFNYWD